MRRRLMLVDDEPNVLRALDRALHVRLLADDVGIETFSDPRVALARASTVAFDLAVADFRMPRMNGVQFLATLRGIQPDTVRVILSASRDFDAVQHAINEAEILRYLCKPWTSDELEAVVRGAFARRDALIADRRLADVTRLVRGELSSEEVERRRLEELEPGITRVNWAPDGSVLLDD
jgi:YesN/AraC family two-component response regulator